MKDRIKPIDVSIISTYMGRSLTAVVAVFVIAVAVSALISRRGVERNVIDVCVSDGHEIARSLQVYEPLTILLSRETRRPVILHACVDTWVSGHDVYIMPIDEFFRHGRRLDLEALFEVKHGERDDEAVLIARDSLGMADCADVSPSQVAFSTPDSVNRFWVQMSMLSQRGFKGPNSLSDFRFEGSAFDGTRVVFGVLYGQYRLGACKRSDIGSLMREGALRAGEITVLDRARVLPEVVIAVPSDEQQYYRRKLSKIGALLDDAAESSGESEIARLLISYGVKAVSPIDPPRIQETRDLFEQYAYPLKQAFQ